MAKIFDTNIVSTSEKNLYEKLRYIQDSATTKKFDNKEHDSKTRSEIALTFTNWYFRLLTIVIFIGFIYNLLILYTGKDIAALIKLQDGVLAISTAIGTPLGFVIGYYFKDGEKK